VKTALVCDWLTAMRGGERCLEAVCELYPDADIFTLFYIPGSVSQVIEKHKIVTSYIQKIHCKDFRNLLPLFPNAIRRFDLSGYDMIVSFSHCVAKDIKVPESVAHICYCHTPMRYAWHKQDEYLAKFKWPKKQLANTLLAYLRYQDRKYSASVTKYIANSRNIQNRIKQIYNRDSVVIYPPVDCARFNMSRANDGYYLIVSALVPYKRVDIAVKAFETLDRKLIIIGKGPELAGLKKVAKRNITFIEESSDTMIGQYLQNCRALVFPGEEDFGIVPLEAQACGKPVIAFGKGGALETVVGLERNLANQNCATGVYFYQQDENSLLEAISFFEKYSDKINPVSCCKNATRFDRPIFKQRMQKYIQGVIDT
jgi:glycosyltransferase involved in cell wall biosynthesis